VRLFTIVGARPQFVKAAVLSRAVRDGFADQIEQTIVHTGQHFDANMSDVFFDELEIPAPAFKLNIPGGSHGASTGRMLEKLDDLFQAEKPDAVLVYGDTNSTLAGALAAVKLHIPVIHVEAGLRSNNRNMPEEINRITTDHISSVLYCSSENSKNILKGEGLADKAVVCGDVMYDCVRFFEEKAAEASIKIDGPFVFMTLHRAENTDNQAHLQKLLDGVGQCDMAVVFPIHPRTKKAVETHNIALPDNLRIVDPMSYIELIAQVRESSLVLTDSGGVQKEAYFLGKPCVTMRTETEWVELLQVGANMLAGHTGQPGIGEACALMLERKDQISDSEVYGDGHSGERIIEDILKRWNSGSLSVQPQTPAEEPVSDFIPLCVPNLSGNEDRYLQECITSTFVSSVGAFVGKFEEMLIEASGAPYGVAMSTGTSALHAAYVAGGVRRDDLVISPALTFIATANAISHAGATPWLMDVNAQSWTLDAAQLKLALQTETERNAAGELIHKPSGRRVCAVTPVFTLGVPADMDEIAAVARENDLKIIVDGAAALGGSYKGKLTGDLGADLTMYSFNGNKMVTAGGGGAVVGHDEELLALLRHLTTTARVGADYDHDMVGYNYRMTNVQAAIGCAQMEQLEVFAGAKRRIDQSYRDAFSNLRNIAGFPMQNDRQSANWFTGFRFTGKEGAARSIALRAFLKKNNIDARPFWKPMQLQKPYADAPRENMTVTNVIWEQIITLPCSTHLSAAEQARVIDMVQKWFEENDLA